MTNLEQLTNDKEKLIELLIKYDDFVCNELEPKWCGKVCPHKDRCREEQGFYTCSVTSREIVEWWLELEATD